MNAPSCPRARLATAARAQAAGQRPLGSPGPGLPAHVSSLPAQSQERTQVSQHPCALPPRKPRHAPRSTPSAHFLHREPRCLGSQAPLLSAPAPTALPELETTQVSGLLAAPSPGLHQSHCHAIPSGHAAPGGAWRVTPAPYPHSMGKPVFARQCHMQAFSCCSLSPPL